jgi:hypothetical protein
MTRDLQAVETKNTEKRMTKMTPAVIIFEPLPRMGL